MINNIKNNAISESDAKKKINKLNKIKHVETKGKRLIDGQKLLLKLFDDLVEAILSNSNNKIVNEDNNKIVNEDNNVNDNDNDKKIMNEDNNKIVNEDNNINDDDSEGDDDDHDEQYYQIKQINRSFKKFDETKSFEDQIDILKKLPCLHDYWNMNYYEDNKETNLRLFKLKITHVFNDVDDNLFKEIFFLTSVKLVDKVISTTSKEENQMLINDIKK